ncbi:MAG TPA: hypothetical protein VND21_04300, partial [Planctomycetota bacterium]|nr:hypothetical protein [Planctomycetota bacterium]
MKRASILLACVLALAGCGDAPAPVLTVEIVSARADPALPREGWRLRGEDGREHPLAPTGARGDRGAIYAAEAPAGRYALAGTSPWAPMSGPTFVALAPGAPALQIAAGIERTLYLAAPPGRRIEDATLWALGVGGPDRELDVELAPGTDDWLVVRFRSPADMKGTVRVAARLDDGTFTAPGRLALPGDGTPWGGALRSGATLPLEVRVLGTWPSPGARLHATAIDDGLESPLETAVGEGGVVRFERFPAARSGARFELRTTGGPAG